MPVAKLSETQLAEIRAAEDQIRNHWQSFRNMPSPGDFAGTLDDIRDLDYLQYEGLGWVSLQVVSIVWGNVIVKQLGFRWMSGLAGESVLQLSDGVHSFCVWPYARFLEAEECTYPQFGRCAFLLERVVKEALRYGELSDSASQWADSVLNDWQQGTPWT
jgi:hypothetical protein